MTALQKWCRLARIWSKNSKEKEANERKREQMSEREIELKWDFDISLN